MKLAVIILLAALTLGLTPAERAIVEHVRQLNIRQKAELEDVKGKLVWTYKELQDKEPQLAQLTKERDDWKKYGEQVQPLQLKVAKQKYYILLLSVGLGLIVAYNVARFTPWGRIALP